MRAVNQARIRPVNDQVQSKVWDLVRKQPREHTLLYQVRRRVYDQVWKPVGNLVSGQVATLVEVQVKEKSK